MKYFLPMILVVAIALVADLSLIAQETGKNRRSGQPNIVIILADDLGYGDVHCYNADSKIPTPNLDQLAEDGMRFTDAHSPSTVCTPTRYSLLTGRMAFRNGMRGVFTGVGGPCLIDRDRLTLPQMLRNAGYRTACIGKWHIGMMFFDKTGKAINKNGLEAVRRVDYSRATPDGPVDRGFDEFFGTVSCPTTDWLYAYMKDDMIPNPPTRILDRRPLPKHPYSRDNRQGMIADDFDLERVDLVFMEKSKDFLKRHVKQNPDQPFFLFHSMQAVHLPSFPAKEFQGKTKSGPHGDFIFEMDHIVGELIKTLKELKVDDNTLVIFTSDNGPEVTSVINMRADHDHDGAKPWRGMKRDNWEGGHRVPMIAKWPGKIESGSTSSQTLCLTDLMATCAAIVDQPLPNDAAEDSYNLLPAFLDAKLAKPIRPFTLHQTMRLALSIRQGKWKYLDHRGSGGNDYSKKRLQEFALPDDPKEAKGQLYDLESDPGETKNLYLQRPQVVRRLKAILDRVKQVGRSVPIRDPSSRSPYERPLSRPEWGYVSDSGGTILQSNDSGKYLLPKDFQFNIVKLWLRGKPDQPFVLEHQPQSDEISFSVPAKQNVAPYRFSMICTKESIQFPDGTIVLSAFDADVFGTTAKLESNPGNYRIGFWTDEKDTVGWTYSATRWGKYDVELVYSQAGPKRTQIKIDIGDQSLKDIELKSTGSWYQYITVPVGRVYLAEDGQTKISITCTEKRNGAVMNLKAVILNPAVEGKIEVAKEVDGKIMMHSRDAKVLGTMLRYEPKQIKRTLGYWGKEQDQAEWRFAVPRKGEFQCKILQGCGKGQGGSRVAIRVYHDRQGSESQTWTVKPVGEAEFMVEDTGHFQNFKSRSVGKFQLEAGSYRLRVVPLEKAKNAVMDLRQLELTRQDKK